MCSRHRVATRASCRGRASWLKLPAMPEHLACTSVRKPRIDQSINNIYFDGINAQHATVELAHGKLNLQLHQTPHALQCSLAVLCIRARRLLRCRMCKVLRQPSGYDDSQMCVGTGRVIGAIMTARCGAATSAHFMLRPCSVLSYAPQSRGRGVLGAIAASRCPRMMIASRFACLRMARLEDRYRPWRLASC